MPEFRVDCGFFGHIKTKRLARLLGQSGVLAVLKLWAYAAENLHGSERIYSAEDIELAIDWDETTPLAENLARVGYLDAVEGGYALHEWAEHNGYAASAAKRKIKAQKAANARWGKPENAQSCSEQCSTDAQAMLNHACSNASAYAQASAPEDPQPLSRARLFLKGIKAINTGLDLESNSDVLMSSCAEHSASGDSAQDEGPGQELLVPKPRKARKSKAPAESHIYDDPNDPTVCLVPTTGGGMVRISELTLEAQGWVQAYPAVDARQLGASVVSLAPMGKGCPDLLIGFRGRNLLAEVKDGTKPPSARGLTACQVTWHQTWAGQVAIVTCLADIYALLLGGQAHARN